MEAARAVLEPSPGADHGDARPLPAELRVGDLTLETFCVDASTTCMEVLGRFQNTPGAFVAAVMRGSRLLGSVTRTKLLAASSGQFGVTPEADRPVCALASPPVLISAEATVSEAAAVALARPGLSSYEPLAISEDGEFIGMLGVIDLMRALAEEQQVLLRVLEDRARELERLQRETLYLAEHDALTGLWNRRAWFASAIAHRPSALAIFDIDHFKHINDTRGHPAGDDVLREVAVRLQSELSGSATLGRLGGEEFGALFTGSWDHALVLSARCIDAVGATLVVIDGHDPITVTLSAGVAPWVTGGPTREHSLAKTYEAADLALYEAKRTGRDRIVVSRPHVAEGEAA